MIEATLDRKQLGRYDTPRPLSQAIVNWVVSDKSGDILEPSVGSGVFVRSIFLRLRDLGVDNPEKQVWACDIDPAACKQTKELFRDNQQHIIQANFLSIVTNTGFLGRKFRLVIGNPPFLSLHHMSVYQREQARAFAKRLNISIDRKASLWLYFIFASLQVLEEDGNLALILPEATLHTQYAKGILYEFSKSFSICNLISIRERCFLDGGASERILIFFGENFRRSKNDGHFFIKECLTVNDAEVFFESSERYKSQQLINKNKRVVTWFLSDIGLDTKKFSQYTNFALGDLANIQIGVVTGANSFFLLSETKRCELKIPKSAVIPVLKSFNLIKGIIFNYSDWLDLKKAGIICWLLFPENKESRESILNYQSSYPESNRERNVTFSKRSPWYQTQIGKTPDAFFQYMGHHSFRVLLSGFSATCTNSIHRVFFNRDISLLKRKAITLSLHSSISQLSAEIEGRTYGSGVLKIEPSEAKRIRLFLPKGLDRVSINKTIKKFKWAMENNGNDTATKVVDKWLISASDGLLKEEDFENIRTNLYSVRQRRKGPTRDSGKSS